MSYLGDDGKSGFSKQVEIESTNNSKRITEALFTIFNQYYIGQTIRNIGVTSSKLEVPCIQQLNLFETIDNKDKEDKFDSVVDTIRKKYGFTKMVYTSSLLEGGRAIKRSLLVGGHAGGMEDLESRKHVKKRVTQFRVTRLYFNGNNTNHLQ